MTASQPSSKVKLSDFVRGKSTQQMNDKKGAQMPESRQSLHNKILSQQSGGANGSILTIDQREARMQSLDVVPKLSNKVKQRAHVLIPYLSKVKVKNNVMR